MKFSAGQLPVRLHSKLDRSVPSIVQLTSPIKHFSPWKRVCPPVTLNPVSNYRHCQYRHCRRRRRRRRRLRMLLFRRPGAGYDKVTKNITKNQLFSFSAVSQLHLIFFYVIHDSI